LDLQELDTNWNSDLNWSSWISRSWYLDLQELVELDLQELVFGSPGVGRIGSPGVGLIGSPGVGLSGHRTTTQRYTKPNIIIKSFNKITVT
jgi:hypothetical protein